MAHRCDECGREFDSERGLHVHQSQQHEEDDSKDTTNPERKESREQDSDGEERLEFSLGIKEVGILAMFFGALVGFTAGIFVGGPGSLDLQFASNDKQEIQADTPEGAVKEIAEMSGADREELASCMDNSEGREQMGDRGEIPSALNISPRQFGTPTFLIGNKDVGFEPISSMKPIIDEQIQEVENEDYSLEDDEYSLENITLEGEPSLGDESAPIYVIEYSDFACPWCAEWAGYDAIPQRDIDQRDSWNKIKENYVQQGEIEFVYKDYPAHQNSRIAHEAANCVWEQDSEAYWKFHDKLFEYRDSWMA
jgi:protein-disulfide isomerase